MRTLNLMSPQTNTVVITSDDEDGDSEEVRAEAEREAKLLFAQAPKLNMLQCLWTETGFHAHFNHTLIELAIAERGRTAKRIEFLDKALSLCSLCRPSRSHEPVEGYIMF
jgi:hypothetical protein